MDYDVALIGAGVTGAAGAMALSRYRLKVALLEKEADVGFGVSKANSGIVHAGFHYPLSTLKGKLEIRGNLMFEKLHYELGFPFRRCGILVAAFSAEELDEVKRLYRQGLENRVPRIEFCSHDRMLELEPKLSHEVTGGLYAPNGGVVEPYRYVFAMVELAQKNGAELFTGFELKKASFSENLWTLESSAGQKIRTRYAINAAGLHADEISRIFGAEEFQITARKGEEYLLDRASAAYPSKVIFPVPTQSSKGVLVIPTVEGTTMIGPTAELVEDKEDRATTRENMESVFRQAKRMVPSVAERDLITSFSGSRPVMAGNDFYIAPSAKAKQFIQAAGIQSPGLTASPAVAEYLCALLKEQGVKLEEKERFSTSLPPRAELRHQTPEEADRLHAEDPAWTNIICRCEKVSEAEIVDAIRHGHTTLDGIKFYTRAGMGRCQGGFCSYKIYKLIARETGIPLEEITKCGGKSRLMEGRLGGNSEQEGRS